MVQERGLLQGFKKGPGVQQGGSIPWVEISAHLRRGARIRHDNMVKNHWNGRLSTSYFNGSLRTAFVRRQTVLSPLRHLVALLQASCCSLGPPVGLPMGQDGLQFTHLGWLLHDRLAAECFLDPPFDKG